MTTVAEQRYQELQTALDATKQFLPEEVSRDVKTAADTINQAQAAIVAAPGAAGALAKTPILKAIDDSKAQMSQVKTMISNALNGAEGAALSDTDRAQIQQSLALFDKLDAYLDAERDETINGPKPATVAPGPVENASTSTASTTPWYATIPFIVLWSILGLALLALIIWAIAHAVNKAKANKVAVPQYTMLGRSNDVGVGSTL